MAIVKKITIAAVLLFLVYCSSDSGIDKTYLEAHRRAIPDIDAIKADVPSETTAQAGALVGDDALIPPVAIGVATDINTQVAALLSSLKTITDTPPTFYDSETNEYLWGPFNNDDSELKDDTIAVYIRDKGEDIGLQDEDLRYEYALLRGMSRDLSTMEPVIWGGHTPDPNNEDYGQGAILYDLQANLAWEDQYNPGHGNLAEGRFAVAYVKQREATGQSSSENADLTIVVGAFRNFVPGPEDWEDSAQKPDAIDAEYLWGGVKTDAGESFSFINVNVNGNIFPFEDPSTGSTEENFGILAAFATNGVGRGRLDVYGDDVTAAYGANTFLEGQECWDTLLERTYFGIESVNQSDSNDRTDIASEGNENDCEQSILLSDIPDLDGLEQEGADLLNALVDLAENGVPSS
ncbi:MAG: hypothetical protein IPJ88_06455 [Myxococcales bacterium]|nr:MAG: hypothetical protein IPJ88_06455 [Myxococcales bacterium]